MKNLLTSLLLLMLWGNAYAGSLSLGGIDQDDLNALGKDFASNFSHSAVRAPVPLGDVFGLELGGVVGSTGSPGFDKLVKEQNSTSSMESIPHFGALIAVSVPSGISGEVVILPELATSGLTISNTSFALRWDASSILFGKGDLKFDAKFHLSSSSLRLDQISGATTISTTFDTSTWGLMGTVGYDMYILRPYLGLGFISASMDTSVTGGTIFDASLTTGSSATSDSSGFHLAAGLVINLVFINLGVEYQSLLETSKVTGKVSLTF